MPPQIDETHDPGLESWVESANDPATDFPIQNLPIAEFMRGDPGEAGFRHGLCTRIGDSVVDLGAISRFFDGDAELREDDDLPYDGARYFGGLQDRRLYLRKRLVQLFAKDNSDLRDDPALRAAALIPVDDVDWLISHEIGDYTDFYASVHHATNVGSMFRPDNPLLPNYKWIPVGYHGRASSVVASRTSIQRPMGQTKPAEEGGAPGFGPSKRLDYEMEMGVVVGKRNALGEPVGIGQADDHILGLCLLNDWSARDMQKWEYVPLGPFLAKSFATTVSPYIVTMEALAPFRCPAYERPAGDPAPLPHLDSDENRAHGGFDINVEVYLASQQMREKGIAPVRLSRANLKDMYWTPAQMIAHHTSNGCNLQPGDLLGSGTISGASRESRGSLLELTWEGDPFSDPPVIKPGTARVPIELPTGETRVFLADGDEVIMRGFCERDGYRRIGFGECRGIVTPASAV